MQPHTTGPWEHWTILYLKLIVLKYFFLPFTLFEPCGAVFIMNSKIHVRKNSLNKYFKAILHYFRVYSLSGFTTAARWTHLVFFAEVQVAILLVLNLPRQGFPATCRIGHCCVCSPLLFASEILCDSPGDSPTYSKQRLNEISPIWWPTSCVAWKPKMHKWPWCHAEWCLSDRKKDLWPMRNHTLLAILLRDKIKIINTFHSHSTTIAFLLL